MLTWIRKVGVSGSYKSEKGDGGVLRTATPTPQVYQVTLNITKNAWSALTPCSRITSSPRSKQPTRATLGKQRLTPKKCQSFSYFLCVR